MPSIHEMRARFCPQPDKPRHLPSSHPPNPNARFGWDVVKRMESPPRDIQRLGEFDVTRERLLRALRGEEVFPEAIPEARESDRKQISQADIDWEALKAARERRRQEAKKIHSPQTRRESRKGSAT